MERDSIIQAVLDNKELRKNIHTKGNGIDRFIDDAQDYVLAIREGRMLCSIKSVSSSGMSRVLAFYSCEKRSDNNYYYRNYNSLFKSLGYTENKAGGFRIVGCGMDMVFHTNYSIIHDLRRLGLLEEKDLVLSQWTPPVL